MTTKINDDEPADIWRWEYLAPPLETWAGQPCSSQWLVHHRLQINAQVCEDSLFLLLFALLFTLFLCHLYLINEVFYLDRITEVFSPNIMWTII